MNDKVLDHSKLSFYLHHAVKNKLLTNPNSVITVARRNLKNWKERYGYGPKWMSDWERIIANGIASIIEVLDGKDEKSVLLRSSSPFAGVLSNKERMRVISETRKS